jgi:hypothetical protein
VFAKTIVSGHKPSFQEIGCPRDNGFAACTALCIPDVRRNKMFP